MTYTVTDIAELVEYHLVASASDDTTADDNLSQLVSHIADLSTRPLFRSAEWLFCDRCGCAVDTDVLAEDGSNFSPDGAFLCSSCLYPDEED